MKNLSTKTYTEKTKLDLFSKAALIVLAVFTLPVFAAMAFNGGAQDTLTSMEAVFDNQQDEIRISAQLLEDKVKNCQLQESTIAKRKAEDHFNGTNVLEIEDLNRVLRKAEGYDLTCGDFM